MIDHLEPARVRAGPRIEQRPSRLHEVYRPCLASVVDRISLVDSQIPRKSRDALAHPSHVDHPQP